MTSASPDVSVVFSILTFANVNALELKPEMSGIGVFGD
jgi:hypothetical protein